MKGTSVHSYTAGQGQPHGDENGAEEDVRDPLCTRVSAAQAETTPADAVFYTGTCPQKDKNGEIICIIFMTSLGLLYYSSVRVFVSASAYGKETNIGTPYLEIFVSFSGTFTSGTSWKWDATAHVSAKHRDPRAGSAQCNRTVLWVGHGTGGTWPCLISCGQLKGASWHVQKSLVANALVQRGSKAQIHDGIPMAFSVIDQLS